MFVRLAEDHHYINKNIKKICNLINPVGSINEYEDNPKNLHLTITQSPDYVFNRIENPELYISIDNKPYNQWNESDVYHFATKIKGEGREVSSDKFSVDPLFLRNIELQWNARIGENVNVDAIPYKIHIYKKGDFLTPRSTSPEDGLIGITLVDLSEVTNSSFRVNGTHGKKWKTWEHNLCSFYTDLIHEVTEVKNSFRVIVAFKIYINGKLNLDVPARSFGILLRHGFCYTGNKMKGIDQILCQRINELDWTYEMVSVIVKESDRNLEIYLAPEEIIERVPSNEWPKQIRNWTLPRNLTDQIPFIILGNGYKWNQTAKNSFYLNKILIVRKHEL